MLRLRGVLLTILRLLGVRAALLSILAVYKRRFTTERKKEENGQPKGTSSGSISLEHLECSYLPRGRLSFLFISMAAHRIGARLAGLSPEQLVAFLDEQAPLWSAAALRVAEEHAARLVEQPEWVLSEVLLSPDLAPHILAQLPTKAHAVKGTCRTWRRAGWKGDAEEARR